MTDSEQIGGQVRALSMHQWRIGLLAMTVLSVMAVGQAVDGPDPTRNALVAVLILLACWMAGSILPRFLDFSSKLSLKGALLLLCPLIALAVLLGLFMRAEFAGEAVIFYIGTVTLRAMRPRQISLWPHGAKEWIPLLLLLLWMAVMTTLIFCKGSIVDWYIENRMKDVQP